MVNINLSGKSAQLVLSLAVLVIAGGLSFYWLSHQPRASREPLSPQATLVEVIVPQPTDFQTRIHSMGAVIASQSVNLNARVSGMVVSVSDHFIEGGFLKKGEPIVQLDPTDFELAVEQKESDLEQAKFNLKLEMGQQAIAQREFELLGTDLNAQAKELVLRQPHLHAAKAAVKAAEAALAQARLDLSRTVPVAPFNAIVIERNANIGSWISTFSTGTPLVKLVATDHFWIDVSVPPAKLRWIKIPEINSDSGAAVKITYPQAWGANRFRHGFVKRLKAQVENDGRMAKLIVEVGDPLSQRAENAQAPPLMLGSLVRVEIAGRRLRKVYRLPESALREGRQLWLLSEQKTLELMDVEPLWSEQGEIFLQSEQFSAPPNVIVSNLSTPVAGMRLRLRSLPPLVQAEGVR